MEDSQKLMEELIQRVVRMFYEPCHVVIMDIMLKHLVLDEEDLADKMKLLPREFNRMAVKLRDDKVLSSETTNDIKADGRQETKTKFFLDFKGICDVIKYKMYTMTQRLERRMRGQESSFGFSCSLCQVRYSVLDAQSFLSDDFTFKCPECQTELKEHREDSAEKETISNIFSQMMEEVSPIIRQLKEIDALGIPDRPKSNRAQNSSTAAVPYEVLQEAKETEQEKVQKEEIEIEEKEKEKPIEDSAVLVEVEGKQKLFKDITEQDKERMSESEYEKYFEICEKFENR